MITLSILTPMKLSYAWYYSIFYKGELNREGALNKFFSPERGGLLERGSLIERGAKKRIYGS